MGMTDLLAAIMLPLPPWVGFWVYRRKGRVGLSYGYFLGGILAVLTLPWATMTGLPIPAPQLGGALFGFTLFLQAQREGAQGIRRLGVGVGGSTLFVLLLLLRLHLPLRGVIHFWGGALVEGLLWLLLSDLAFRLARGRQLEVRMPVVGASALVGGALLQFLLPAALPRLSLPAAGIAGVMLGWVALQQLRWLREQGAWVEGRGQGLRLALALIEKGSSTEGPALSLGLDPRQPMILLDAKGRILESNGPFNNQVGMARHRLRGYALNALFQGSDLPVWDSIRGQLEQYGCATLQATQVSEDGSFQGVTLQSSSFDRGMALLWVGDTVPGSLTLRGGEGAQTPAGEDAVRRHSLNALMALSLTQDQLARTSQASHWAEAAERLAMVASRLAPGRLQSLDQATHEAGVVLERLQPKLHSLLPADCSLEVQADALPLRTPQDTLERIVIHLLLHALQGSSQAPLTLSMTRVDLGGRIYGLLQVQNAQATPARTIFGQSWLRQAVMEAGGLLELDQDATKGLQPRVYLPVDVPSENTSPEALKGHCIWIVDQDPLAQETLKKMVELAGGEAVAFPDLRLLLAESRRQPAPAALVLERTRSLERYQRALRTFQKAPIPTLVMGMGQPLPINPADMGLRRLGFIEKPFSPTLMIESLLALLHASGPQGVG
jgi:hypothetical protein